jgi:hypothetical protein
VRFNEDHPEDLMITVSVLFEKTYGRQFQEEDAKEFIERVEKTK